MDFGVFCGLFVVCICVYIIYSAGYVELPIVLLYLLRCLVYHMLSKTRRNSRSLHRVMACICYVYFDAWCITYCSKREETLEVYTVIGEVLVLGLLVVVWKIPYSGCILNTAVVMEAGKMVCGYHTAVYLVHGSCMCYTWYVLVVSPDVVDIGSESFVVYLSCVYYVRLVMPSYLLFCCTRVSTSMLGIAHAVQNERKLWNFTQ